jgi:Ca-activated chloride channel family protein
METSALSFARPLLLHALWLLPLVAVLFWWSEHKRRAMIGRIVAPKLRAMLAGNASPVRRWFRHGCVVVALGLLVVALAGPRVGYDTLELPHRGRDVIIAMDVSRSMLAPDVAPTRLQRAKLLTEDLISELGSDRIGLVAFAGSAFLQAPLTLDHGAVLAALDELDTTVIPKGGTNIAAAIRTAEEAFGKAEGFFRALIIVSDGEELDADGVAAAKQAAARGVKIFTVGVGSTEGSEIPLGAGDFVRDPSGKVVQSRLDSARMKEIAEATGGFYTPLDENAARLLAVDGVGKLAEADITTSSSRRPVERYQWPLGVAIGLLVLQALVGERRRRPASVLSALLMLTAHTGWSAPPGLAAYEQGDYELAKQAFEKRLQMEPEAPALQLNAGAAAYRLKDYGTATEYFSRAMLAADPALRSSAEFNLGNTLFRQGEEQQDKEKKITDWKDAIAKYEAALKTRPDYQEAKENKERVQKLLEELEKKQQQEQEKQDQKQDRQKQDQSQQKDQQKQDQQQQSGQGQQDQKDQSSGEKQKDQQKSDSGKQDQQDQQQGGQKQDQPSSQGGKNQQRQQGQGEKKDEQGKQGEQSQEGQSGKEDQQKQDGSGQGEQMDKRDGQQGQPEESESGEKQEPHDNGDSGQPRPQTSQPGDQPAPIPQQSGEKKEGELRGGQQGSAGQQGEQQTQAAAEEEVDGQMSAGQARALLRSLQGEEEQVQLLERRNFQDVSKDW